MMSGLLSEILHQTIHNSKVSKLLDTCSVTKPLLHSNTLSQVSWLINIMTQSQ